VKAALLISGADRRKYGKLKDELANNYLWARTSIPILLRKHYVFSGTIKPQQTACHTGPVQTTQVWCSSNEGGEVDVEQDKEGKDAAMTRAEAPGAAQPEMM
jgi:hypothetical protein